MENDGLKIFIINGCFQNLIPSLWQFISDNINLAVFPESWRPRRDKLNKKMEWGCLKECLYSGCNEYTSYQLMKGTIQGGAV